MYCLTWHVLPVLPVLLNLCCAGMVLTDLLLQGASPAARRFFNVLAEEPETVAAAVVPQIRAVQVRDDRAD